MSKIDNNFRKCKHCGKYLSYKQMQDQKDVMFVYSPDNEFSVQVNYWVHKSCW